MEILNAIFTFATLSSSTSESVSVDESVYWWRAGWWMRVFNGAERCASVLSLSSLTLVGRSICLSLLESQRDVREGTYEWLILWTRKHHKLWQYKPYEQMNNRSVHPWQQTHLQFWPNSRRSCFRRRINILKLENVLLVYGNQFLSLPDFLVYFLLFLILSYWWKIKDANWLRQLN